MLTQKLNNQLNQGKSKASKFTLKEATKKALWHINKINLCAENQQANTLNS